MSAFGVIPHHRPQPQPESLGFVVARVDRHGQATLTGASVYELREDADWHAAKCKDRAPAGLEIKVCQVVPVPP